MNNVDLSELIAALPQELDNDTELAHEQLREIFADLALRPVPVHSLHRLWSVGELSVQIALAYLALWARKWFDDPDARKLRVMETNLRLALKTLHRLGYLRGAMIKVGSEGGNLPLFRRLPKRGFNNNQFAGLEVNIIVVKIKLLPRALKFYFDDIIRFIICWHIHVRQPIINI